MKSRYNNYDELASAWADDNFDAANGMSTYGDRMKVYPGEPDSIYSYGPHFCIAKKFRASDTGRHFILFTERDYSPTTGRHKKAVWSAVSSHEVVCLPHLELGGYVSDKDNKAYFVKLTTEGELAELVLSYAVAKLETFAKSCLAKRPHKTHPEKFLALLAQAHAYVRPFPQITLPDYTDTFEAIKAHCRVQIAKARLITA